MNTALEQIKAIVDANLQGASEYHGNGWWHQVKRTQVRHYWTLQRLDSLRDKYPECVIGQNRVSYTLVATDTDRDIEYDVTIERSAYIGKPDYIIVDKVYNASLANS